MTFLSLILMSYSVYIHFRNVMLNNVTQIPLSTLTNLWDCGTGICTSCQRGWTAWTLAAVDKRVIGLVPMVMDLVNMQPVRTTTDNVDHVDGCI